MNRVKRSLIVSLVLGMMSISALATSHLALTDIWHGESDVSLEWNMLRLGAIVILLFHVSAIATMWQVLGKLRES